MNLNDISEEIRNVLEEKRKQLNLTFEENEHVYTMLNSDGKLINNFPSVTSVIKKFYKPFDAYGISLSMCKYDEDEASLLREEWKKKGDYSTNLGSRVHYILEKEAIKRYGSYKQVRKPIFTIDEEQKKKSDNMIKAGKDFLSLMEDRGAVLLDTESVLGCPINGYVGQPDKLWLINNRANDEYGIVCTDWKTNQPKNFEVYNYTDNMFSPFEKYPNNALGHYYIQLPLYGRLLLSMLKETKFENLKIFGNIVVLLKDDGTFQEYRIPKDILTTVLNLDIKKYLYD